MRILHRLYAEKFGYFWLPCPECGEMFGGHETRSSLSVAMHDKNVIICRKCSERRIEIFMMTPQPKFVAGCHDMPRAVAEFAAGFESERRGEDLPESAPSSFKAGFYTALNGNAPWSYGGGAPEHPRIKKTIQFV